LRNVEVQDTSILSFAGHFSSRWLLRRIPLWNAKSCSLEDIHRRLVETCCLLRIVFEPEASIPYFIVPILETPLTWRDRSPYSYIPGTGWPSYSPGHWVPFPSPLTTRRATVEVFYPASTREKMGFKKFITSRHGFQKHCLHYFYCCKHSTGHCNVACPVSVS
jgi:hypothetical protein